MGTTTHQALLGVLARPGGLCPPGAPPLVIFAPKILKYSEKNRIKFSGHSENFFFWVIFVLHVKFRKQTKHGILFYLTNKNRE